MGSDLPLVMPGRPWIDVPFLYSHTSESWQVYGIQGMALWCPEDVLKAAGLSRDLYQVIDLDATEKRRVTAVM